MSSTSSPHFDRFSRKLHRRFVLLRGVEKVGAALLFGCVAAVILVGIVWWTGGSTFPVVMLALGVSGLVGLLTAILRRPTVLDAVMEADRQLKLADLFGTALLIQRSANARSNPWNATILALAEGRCRRLPVSNVLLARWTPRRWGGVGLAMILVLMLGVFSNVSPRSQAESGAVQVFAKPDSLGAPQQISRSVNDTAAGRGAIRHVEHDPEDSSAGGLPGQSTVRTETDKSGVFDPAASKNPATSAGDRDGSGAGASGNSGVESVIPPLNGAGGAERISAHGPTAGGGQADNRSDSPDNGKSSADGLAGSGRGSVGALPWQSDAWEGDRQKAGEILKSGETYDSYRDLIRDYFEHRD